MRLSQCLPIHPLCLMANTVPCANASGGRCIRVWELMRACLGAEADASGSRGADWNRERGAKHNRSLGRQSEGRIMQRSSRHQHHCALREISVLFHFAQGELQCFAFFGSLEIRQFVLTYIICQKRFKCQNNFDCLLIICKFAGNPMESHGGGVFSTCRQKPFPTTPQGRDREDWGIP